MWKKNVGKSGFKQNSNDSYNYSSNSETQLCSCVIWVNNI